MRRLETSRLIMRKFTIHDANDLFKVLSNKSVAKRSDFKTYNSKEDVILAIECAIKDYGTYESTWAIEEKQSNKVIGYISMKNTSLKNKQCTLTWALGKPYWGLGYSEELLKTMLKYLFEEHPFEIIISTYYNDDSFVNPILESVGMKKDAVLRNRRINPLTGEKEALIVYSILKEEANY